jgi:hypothetical protein
VRCPAEKGIEVIFDYFGQRFLKVFALSQISRKFRESPFT